MMANSSLDLGHEDTSAARKDHLTGPVVCGGMKKSESILKDWWALASQRNLMESNEELNFSEVYLGVSVCTYQDSGPKWFERDSRMRSLLG